MEQDDLIIRLTDKCVGHAVQAEKHRVHAEHLLQQYAGLEEKYVELEQKNNGLTLQVKQLTQENIRLTETIKGLHEELKRNEEV